MHASGRLHLRQGDDAAAVAAVKAAWEKQDGGFNVDEYGPAGTLADIAWAALAAFVRDGDWIEVSLDEDCDPKWSYRAIAFYVAIAPFVREGTVHLEGEDGAEWSYIYLDGQITQRGLNGYEPEDFPG